MLEDIMWSVSVSGNSWYNNEVRKQVYLNDLKKEKEVRGTFFSLFRKIVEEEQ